ncbi:hypothetical protein QM201_18635 [Enterobacter asburiae]|nr:hypothetical protein [Enterobacter asburiae]
MLAKVPYWRGRRPDKRLRPSGIITTTPLPDGGYALSGLQKSAFSETGTALYPQYDSEGLCPR